MTPERAATLLKIPLSKKKTEVVVARKELKECFLRSVHMRYWVDLRDSNYNERITQRHIYEGHENKHFIWKLVTYLSVLI